jgi:hypothetical protein
MCHFLKLLLFFETNKTAYMKKVLPNNACNISTQNENISKPSLIKYSMNSNLFQNMFSANLKKYLIVFSIFFVGIFGVTSKVNAFDIPNNTTYYFDNSQTQWGTVYFFVGHASYLRSYVMTSGSNDIYSITMATWNGATAVYFGNGSGGVSAGSGSYNVSTAAGSLPTPLTGKTANFTTLPPANNYYIPFASSGTTIAGTWATSIDATSGVLGGTSVMYFINQSYGGTLGVTNNASSTCIATISKIAIDNTNAYLEMLASNVPSTLSVSNNCGGWSGTGGFTSQTSANAAGAKYITGASTSKTNATSLSVVPSSVSISVGTPSVDLTATTGSTTSSHGRNMYVLYYVDGASSATLSSNRVTSTSTVTSYNTSGLSVGVHTIIPVLTDRLVYVKGSSFTITVTSGGCTSASEPTTQSNTMNFSSISSSGMTVGWNNGNGTNRIVVAKAGSAPTGTPTDQSVYTANAIYGSVGTALGDGFVVYNGTGNSVAVSGLAASTTYHFKVFEYNGAGCPSAGQNYLITGTPLSSSQITNAPPSFVSTSSGGNWNVGASWVGGVAPGASNNVQIVSGAVITITSSITHSGVITVDAGGTLASTVTFITNANVNLNGTFRVAGSLSGGSSPVVTGSGTWTYGASSTLEFNSSSTYNIDNDTEKIWPTTNGPRNVSLLSGGLQLNNNIARTINGTLLVAGTQNLYKNGSGGYTVNGILQINSGGLFGNQVVTYGAASTLKFNTGGSVSSMNGQWITGAGGPGVALPANVQVSGNTSLTIPNSSGYTIKGNLTIDAGSTVNTSSANALTVTGSVLNSGTLALGGSANGDINVGGDWTNSGTFTHNSRTVTFNGTGNQTITKSGGETFGHLVVNKASGDLRPGSDINIAGNFTVTAGNVQNNSAAAKTITMTGASSTLTVNGSVTGIDLGGGNDINFTYNNSGGTLTVSGTATVFKFFNANVTAGSTLSLSRGIEVKFGVFTMNGTLRLNSGGFVSNATNAVAPTYGVGSNLLYYANGVYRRGKEWSSVSGAGRPYNVQLSNNTTFDHPNATNSGLDPFSTALNIQNDLTIDAGSSFYMDYGGNANKSGSITVGGNVTVNGNMSLGDASGGDLTIGGNYTVANTSVPINNGRSIIFNGTTTQLITKTSGGVVYFDYLLINKASNNVQLTSGTDVAINTTSGDVLQLNNVGGLDLNGRTLTLANLGGNIAVNASGRTISSSIPGGLININANTASVAKSVTGAGTLIIGADVTIRTSAGINFGASKTTIEGTLQILANGYVSTNLPTYGSSSTLHYNSGNYTRGFEWGAGSTAGVGVPQNVILNLTSAVNTLTLGSDRTVPGTLTLTSGIVNTPANTLSATNVSGGSTSSYVNGNLALLNIASGNSSRLFPIGSASVYSPTTVDINSVSGAVNLTAKSTAGNPTAGSGINQSAKANHYWTITKSGAGTFGNYDVTFDFTNTSNTGTVNQYKVRKYDGSWATTTSSVTGNTVKATALTTFSDFEVGEILTYTIDATAGANGNMSPLGSVNVEHSANQLFTFTPDAGYHILDVLVDGVSNPGAVSAGEYTFSNVTADHTISVTFEQDCSGYTWTGAAMDYDFNNPVNWACGIVPMSGADITIDDNAELILLEDFTLGDITFSSGSVLDLNGYILTITGTINGTSNFRGSASSDLLLDPTSAVGALNFETSYQVLRNLVVNANASLGTPLEIVGGSDPGSVTVGSGATLATNDNLILKSDVDGTARVGQCAGAITGKVETERYIRQNTSRGWRMLAVPTKGSQTINASWQEGATSYTDNPNPGFGTRITANTPSAVADGYDAQTFGNSLLSYTPGTSPAWIGVTSATTSTPVATDAGWMLYVRGDRTVDTAQAITSPSATVLRTKGELYVGNETISTVNGFNLVGNIYASEIDFTDLNRTSVNNTFYVWDPKLTGSYGLGAFQSFSSPDWLPTPGGGSYGNTPNTKIQSGMAFLVESGGAGSVGFTESAKSVGTNAGANGFRPSAGFSYLSTNLYAGSGATTSLADGNRTFFDGDYNNAVNTSDVLKASNFGEGIGMYRDGKLLQTERRQPIAENDFIEYRISGAKTMKYKLEFVPTFITATGIKAFLEDKYLNTSVEISLSAPTAIEFNANANQTATFTNRFKLVFRAAGTVPVRFTTVKATQQGTAMHVEWTVAAETGITKYEVEHSTNGTNFTKVGEQAAQANTGATVSYSWLDATPAAGINYYRVKSVNASGEVVYTTIVKVVNGQVISSIVLVSNPVRNNVINMQFNNQEKGNYVVKVMDSKGQQVVIDRVAHTGGNATVGINLPSVAKGMYQVEVQSPNTSRKSFKVVVE